MNLADARLGTEVIAANDEFFAPKERLILSSQPEWREGAFTDRGKWMDGWETRRRREPGSDWCVIALGAPGSIDEFVVDTTHFSGNHPEACTVQGADRDGSPGESDWFTLLGPVPLEGDTRNRFEVPSTPRVSHLRLIIHPDGGVARLRAYGAVLVDWPAELEATGEVDLASARLGGGIAEVSDAHFSDATNLLSVGPSRGMFDGWETARRRGPGHDWVDVALAIPGSPNRIVIDTTHFKGNPPARIRVTGTRPGRSDSAELVPLCSVEPDAVHEFEPAVSVVVDRVRLEIHPDGGVARFRVLGSPDKAAVADRMVTWLNALHVPEATARFASCCGAGSWASQMARRRPFPDAPTVLATASEVFTSLTAADWEEAFAAHPRIGERAGRQDERGEAWSEREQSGVTEAAARVRAALAEGNLAYEDRFDRTYIVRAAGRSAEELLSLLEERLANDPEEELRVAAGEQREITALRLERLLGIEEL